MRPGMNDPQWLPSPQQVAEAKRKQGGRELVIGLVLLVIGVVITAATYNAAHENGGRYVLAYGPIAVGAINIIRGLFHLAS